MKLSKLTCSAIALTFGLGVGVAAAHAADSSMDADDCKRAWSMASPDGKTLSEGQATDYVLNFTMADSNKDAKLDADEFSAACAKGEVKADAATVKDMN